MARMTKPRHRLATTARLEKNAHVTLSDNAAHYLTHVLRLRVGDSLILFSKNEGAWRAVIRDVRKRAVELMVEACLRPPSARGIDLTVCFAPIKGGRMETIIEKATELGATVLQPVTTARTIVDKVNLERAESIAREAAEQCERIDWPEIREPVKLTTLLADWPARLPLVYGDESGGSDSVMEIFASFRGDARLKPPPDLPPIGGGKMGWGVLAGPEGGFTSEEFVALKHCKAACGVSLGPRILRADTAIITLCALTLAAWGDWHERPRFAAP